MYIITLMKKHIRLLFHNDQIIYSKHHSLTQCMQKEFMLPLCLHLKFYINQEDLKVT